MCILLCLRPRVEGIKRWCASDVCLTSVYVSFRKCRGLLMAAVLVLAASYGLKLIRNQYWHRLKEGNGIGLDTRCEEMMIALPNKLCSGNHKAAEEEVDHGTLGEEIWSQKCGQQDSSTAGRRWRRRLKTEMDGKIGLWSMFHLERQGIFKVSQVGFGKISVLTQIINKKLSWCWQQARRV